MNPRTEVKEVARAEVPQSDAPPSRLVIIGLLLGIILATLDGTIVGTALPTIVGELGGLDQLSWVITAYLLTTAVSTPIWGSSATSTAARAATSRRSCCSSPDPYCAESPRTWGS